MATACDYERVGPPFGAGGDALVFAGEVVEVQFALEELSGASWVAQDLTGRAFAFRVVGRGGAVPVNEAGVNDIGAGVAAFTIAAVDTAALLTGTATRVSYLWEFCEVTDAGRQVIMTGDMTVLLLADPDASLPTPTTGTALEAITRYTIRAGEPQVSVRYIGQKGDQGYAGWAPVYALASDGVRRVFQIADWTGGAGTKPATGQYVGASGLVSSIADGVDIAAGLNEAGDTVIEQIAAAGLVVTGVGGTIDQREDTALAAVAAREGQAINTGGAIDVREDAALAAIAAAEDAILDPVTGTLAVAEAATLVAVAAQGVTSTAIVTDAQASALLAVAVAQSTGAYASTTAAMSKGVVSLAFTAGSGGTNGTFEVLATGGAGIDCYVQFVVSGGSIVSATILSPGTGFTSAPSVSVAGSSGLTGTITATIGTLTSVGEFCAVRGGLGGALDYYEITAGPTATYIGSMHGPIAPQALRQVQQRYDYQVSSGARDYPALVPVRPYAWTFTGGGARNADGTVTLPAGATWVSPSLNYAPFDVAGNLYLYIPLTTETTSALEIKIHQAGTIVAAGNTVTQPSAGVYRQTWSNTAPLSSVTITVTNVGSTSVAAFDPEVTATDSAYLPRVLSYSDHVIVEENRRVIDWDLIAPYARWGADKGARDMGEASITVAFDSVAGSDAAAGTRYAPKQTLDAGTTLAQDAVVGFKRGSTWREHYPDLGSTTKGLRLRDYADGGAAKDFPMFKGCQDVSTATWTLESGTCWKTTLTVSSAVTSYYGYDYMKVIQTTVADAATMPLGSTAALTRASSKANCIATAGTFFTEDTTSTLRTVYVNPNDATIPSSSTLYTYEVTDRYCLFNWSAGNPRMQVMQGLEVYDSSFGYGAISGASGAKYAGIIASHGGRHTLKIEAGEVSDFILYNKGNTESSSGNCYISPTGNGFTWRWTNGMAYACYPSAFYSHTAAGTFASGEYSYLWVDGERQSNGALILGDGFNCDSVTAVTAEWCYIKGFQRFGRAGNYAAPVNGTLKNCLIRESGIGYSWKLTEHCIVQVENQSDPDSVNNRGSIMIRVSEDHVVQNCIFYAKNTDVSGYAAALSDYTTSCIDPVVTGINSPNVRRNIFLVDTTLATNQTLVSEAGVITWQSDYNVFIFCTPGNISSYKSGGATKATVADYLSVFTGHDANSLFIDLRDDPRGAQAVFIDPANGDFRWAQTEVAEQVKAYCIANDCGPDWTLAQWPTMPTVDDARKDLMRKY